MAEQAQQPASPPAPSRWLLLLEHWRVMTTLGVLLMLIWGGTFFILGSFSALVQQRQIKDFYGLVQPESRKIERALLDLSKPLDEAVNDPGMAAALTQPATVSSLPMQRVLYDLAFKINESELYVVELNQQRVGRTAGAAPLPAGVMERLKELAQSLASPERMLLGVGQRSGQLLLARRVPAPLPLAVYLLQPLEMNKLGATLQQMLAASAAEQAYPASELGLTMPHVDSWAWWLPGQLGFDVQQRIAPDLNLLPRYLLDVTDGERTTTVLSWLPDWPGTAVTQRGLPELARTSLLPQLMMLGWAIWMTLMTLWAPLAPVRSRLESQLGPRVAPVVKLVQPMRGWLQSCWHVLHAWWDKITAKPPMEQQLVSGPGAFAAHDFQSGAPRITNGPAVKKFALRVPTNQSFSASRPLPAQPAGDGTRAVTSPQDMREIILDCLEHDRVEVAYQPMYRASDNTVVMHEVFLRLVRRSGEVMLPGQFLPTAIQFNMTLALDLAVFKKVLNEHFAGNSMPQTPLALNISSTSLDGVSYLQEMVRHGPKVLQRLAFEVRSQEMVRDQRAMKLLKEIQRNGGSLAVDYFGGGAAMLQASKAIGFNYVKVDAPRYFENEARQEELRNLAAAAKDLKMPLIVERVEDPVMEDFMRSVGAAFLQGFALAKPHNTLNMQPLPPRMAATATMAALAAK